MFECICRCIKGEYKGLEFRFTVNGVYRFEYPCGYHLFFKDLRQASDFIIKFFLNAYETEDITLSLDNKVITMYSPSIEIERAVI